MKNNRTIVGVACHDAGGAEIVSSYIIQNNIVAKYCLEGPAINVFERRLGNIEIIRYPIWLAMLVGSCVGQVGNQI